MSYRDLLFEILTEELPPKSLWMLAQNLGEGIREGLDQNQLVHQEIKVFASPRRLAVLVHHLASSQPVQEIERQGPALKSAFDAQGNPTQAALGFAASCGVSIEQLQKKQTDKGIYLVLKKTEPGKPIEVLIPAIINEAIRQLPIPKPMRWGDLPTLFIRPVHAITLLYGNEVIPAEILNLTAGRQTLGHRFLCHRAINLSTPKQYSKILKTKGYVIPDFEERQSVIRTQLEQLALKHGYTLKINENLLQEVTAIVEWPVALLVPFSETYLHIPQEALISFMEKHQRCFPLFDDQGNLQPAFITISNLESLKPEEVIAGNQRVMHARLSDAKFFYESDTKIALEKRVPALKEVLFQTKLGSLWDKTERLQKLARWIAEQWKVNSQDATRAALLSKADLLTEMVGEFPELQGIMGKYYALLHGENQAVATALEEQYQPHHAKDVLPKTDIGRILALSERIDTLVGIFGIHQAPTGDKDPYGLKRAALGIVRILVETLPAPLLPLREVLTYSQTLYSSALPNENTVTEVLDCITDRLRSWLLEAGFSQDEIQAVFVLKRDQLNDIVERVKAVQAFRKLPEAKDLATTNKRVSNLLAKTEGLGTINPHLLQEAAEKELALRIEEKETLSKRLAEAKDYVALLTDLSTLNQPVNRFFDEVMVMVEDEALRINRLTLLARLKALFLQVADISVLLIP